MNLTAGPWLHCCFAFALELDPPTTFDARAVLHAFDPDWKDGRREWHKNTPHLCHPHNCTGWLAQLGRLLLLWHGLSRG
jgi:hypothetical protein